MNRPAELRCPRCGAAVFATDDRCMSCGAELLRGQPVEQASAALGEGTDEAAEAARLTPVEYRTLPAAPPLRWTDIPVGGGFFDTLSRSWTFFAAALRMLTGHPVMLVPAMVSVVVALAILGAGYLTMRVTGVWEMFIHAPREATPWQFWALAAPFVLLAYTAMMAFMGMVVHMVDVYLKGRRATLRQAFADVVHNFPALFYLAVVNTAVDLLTSLLRNKRRSAIERTLTEAVDTAQRVSTHLLVPVIMLEDRPLKEATQRAYALFRWRLLDVIVGEAGLLLANRVVSFLALAPMLVLIGWAAWVAKAMVPIVIGVAVGLLIVLEAITGFVRTAYYTCLYLWAAAMEAAATDAVPAPEPLAKALAA